MEELKELPPFLKHDRPEVRLQACQILAGYSSSPEHQKFIQSLNVIRTLRNLMTDDDANISKTAITVLVNLSEHGELREEMVTAGTIQVSMDVLRDRNNNTHQSICCMLLANLTISDDGTKKVMQEGSALEGLSLRLLITWLLEDVRPGATDRYLYASHVITNISRTPTCQKLLIDKERGILTKLISQLNVKAPERRHNIISAIKNCFIDTDNQEQLLSPEKGILLPLLLTLTGPYTLDEEDSGPLLPEIQEAIALGVKKPHFDGKVRRVVLDIIHICATHKRSRDYLKSINTYHLIREYHKWENEQEEHDLSQELDIFIEDLVQYFLVEDDEDELSKQVAGASIEEIKEEGKEQKELDVEEDVKEHKQGDEKEEKGENNTNEPDSTFDGMD